MNLRILRNMKDYPYIFRIKVKQENSFLKNKQKYQFKENKKRNKARKNIFKKIFF